MRALFWFWGTLLLGLASGAGALQALGPPIERMAEGAAKGAVRTAMVEKPRAPGDAAAGHEAAAPAKAAPTEQPLRAQMREVASGVWPSGVPRPSGAVSAPDAALQEPSAAFPGAMLPRIGADHRRPSQAYAAAFNHADRRPRIAILLGGYAMSEMDSMEAATALPAAVSFAVSPYAHRADRLLEAARLAGHELLVEIPMEPLGFPLNDAGDRALLTGLPPAQNQERLEWALSRFTGYVGATNALDGMRGERLAASVQLAAVLHDLSERGLLFVDAAASLPAPLPERGALPYEGRPVDVVIDDPAVRPEIEARLAQLEGIAHDRGAALGLAGLPRPVTVGRIAAWAATLGSRGFVLVPVTAVQETPLGTPLAQGEGLGQVSSATSSASSSESQ